MSLTPCFGVRKTARHARRSTVPVAIAVGGLAAVFVPALAGTASAAPSAVSLAAPAAASSSDFARLRGCESGGNYAINTGNGYYGAYQFSAGTWRGLGYQGLPHQASPATQDAAAARLQSAQGWQPWPGCARALGLGSGQSASRSGPTAPAARASRGGSRSAVVAVAVARPGRPSFDGRIITTADVNQDLASVRAWQGRMAARGWSIAVDGHFGPQSSGVAKRFAAEKHLSPATPGSVDKAVFDGAWTIAVS